MQRPDSHRLPEDAAEVGRRGETGLLGHAADAQLCRLDVYKRQALGIQGFWNFSHYDLSVSYPDVVVENVHLGDSLMSLGYRLRNQD